MAGFAASARVSLFPCLAFGQKGIGSLNDPCDCMQHHDYWMATKSSLFPITEAPDFFVRIFDPQDTLHTWMKVQSCMYSPENEEAHRPTALSDCIPGFIFTHVVCMQRHIVDREPHRVMAFAHELARLLPWGARCIDSPDGSSDSGWPFSSSDVLRYYRRVKRSFAAGPASETAPWSDALLKDMTWKGGSVQRDRFVLANGAPSEIFDGELEALVPSAISNEMQEQIASIHEMPEVCPAASFPQSGVCWVLGTAGLSCRDACRDAGLVFHSVRGRRRAAVEHKIPRLLMLAYRLPRLLAVQHAWAAFECYVPGENRFHKSSLSEPMGDGMWNYPLCSLACPCRPGLSDFYRRTLERVPIFAGVS